MNSDIIVWSPGVTLDDIEKQVINKAYQFYQRNKAATARALGISVKTLDNKFERYADEDAAAEKARLDEYERREEFLRRSRFGNTERPADGAAGLRHDSGADQRHGVESAAEPSGQQALSVPVDEEIQALLPAEAPARRRRRAGG